MLSLSLSVEFLAISRALSEYCFACGSLTNETVLGTNPNRTHDQPNPYLDTAETVLDLYSDKGMLPFLLHGAHKRNSLKIDAFPFSNRTRNRTRTAAEFQLDPFEGRLLQSRFAVLVRSRGLGGLLGCPDLFRFVPFCSDFFGVVFRT